MAYMNTHIKTLLNTNTQWLHIMCSLLNIGDINDKDWISDVDGNVWEPGVAMWHEAE